MHGGFPLSSEAEAGGLADYPLSETMRHGLPTTSLSKARRDGQRRAQQGVQSQATQATALFRPPQRASTADRECYASAEVHTDSNQGTYHCSVPPHHSQPHCCRCGGSLRSSARR